VSAPNNNYYCYNIFYVHDSLQCVGTCEYLSINYNIYSVLKSRTFLHYDFELTFLESIRQYNIFNAGAAGLDFIEKKMHFHKIELFQMGDGFRKRLERTRILCVFLYPTTNRVSSTKKKTFLDRNHYLILKSLTSRSIGVYDDTVNLKPPGTSTESGNEKTQSGTFTTNRNKTNCYAPLFWRKVTENLKKSHSPYKYRQTYFKALGV